MAERRRIGGGNSVTDDDIASESVPLLETSTNVNSQVPSNNSAGDVGYVL